MYPIPANESLFIEFNEILTNDVDVKIFNVSGRQVLTNASTLLRSCAVLEIDLEKLNSGIYLLKIQHEEKIIEKNILVKH